MNNSALIIVDVQNDYFPGGKWTLSAMESTADNVARLLADARSRNEFIVHIRHEFADDKAPFFCPGSDGAKIHEKAANLANEKVILKHHVNAFRDTDLKEVLDTRGIEEITICGAMSHMCIDAIIRAASDYGYRATVVHDACASRDLEFNGATIPAAQVHAAYMASLGFAYAAVVSTDEALAKSATRTSV